MFPLSELFMKPYQFLSGHNVPEAQSVYLQMARYRDVNKFSTQNYCAVVASPFIVIPLTVCLTCGVVH